jgi:hypothetical protein
VPADAAKALSYAGLRNVRDNSVAAALSGLQTLSQLAGVHIALITNTDIAGTLAMAEQLHAAGALLAIEGPNEPNNFPVTYMGLTSSASTSLPVARFQRDLYAAVKADAALSGIPVFHSSEAGGSEPDDVGLQFLTIPSGVERAMPIGTRYADYANTHNYVCGHQNVLVDNVAWQAADRTLNGQWDGLYVEYSRTWSKGYPGYASDALLTLPWVTTETGWTTRGTGSITEEQQGRVLMNVYLAAFKRGVKYTFVYMLRDDPVQGYWGMFDVTYQPKRIALYLHNLTTILADTSIAATGKLDYAIDHQPATVHDLLLQKSDGKFALIVWGERHTGGSDTIAINLGKSRASLSIYDPVVGTTPTQTLSDVSTVSLTLTDHPLALEL